MNVHDIVIEYLEKRGFEGLFCEDCSCEASDLFPCRGNNFSNCKAGHKISCPVTEECCDLHIGEKNG